MGLFGDEACAGRFLADHLEQGSVHMQVLYNGEPSWVELSLMHSRALHWLISAWLTPAIVLCQMEECQPARFW